MRQTLKDGFWRLVRAIDQRYSDHIRIVAQPLLHTVPEQEHLKKLIRLFEIDCIFDVGANNGQYAQMLRDHVRYTGHIVSFEPIPDCAAHLRELSRFDEKWHVEEAALSDRTGETSFNIMAYSEFSSLSKPIASDVDLSADGNEITESVQVRMDTIGNQFDVFQKRLGFRRPFLKMDTQGHDLFVARGAGDRLANFVALQSELSIVPIYAGMPNYSESIAFYESRGFKLSAFVPNNYGHFPRLIETDCIMYNSDLLKRIEELRT